MIEKVISGGQTGADIAGLRAAKACGIPTGGFIPKGYKTLGGPKAQYEHEFNLVAIDTPSYAERTRLNVMQSDCTVRFAFDFGSAGERCTLNNIRYYAKPYFDIKVDWRLPNGCLVLPEKLIAWILENKFKVINIAGNSERTYVGMEKIVYGFLVTVFEEVNNLTVV